MNKWIRELKPSRWCLLVLIASALVALGFALAGYRPASLHSPMTATSRSEFMASVIAVVATLIGVAIAGWVTLEQLDSEREDRRKERRLAAKHAALIDAIRGIHKMLAQISRLALMETEESEITKAFGEGASQAAPGWAAADLESVKLLQRLNNDLAMTFLRLRVKRAPLVAMHDGFSTSEKLVQSAHAENQRLFLRQTEATGMGDTDAAERWSEMFRWAVEQMPRMREELRMKQTALEEARVPFGIECVFEARRLAGRYRLLLAHIRKEIEVDDVSVTLDDFLSAADMEDRMVLRTLKTAYPLEYHDDLDRAAVNAGCSV